MNSSRAHSHALSGYAYVAVAGLPVAAAAWAMARGISITIAAVAAHALTGAILLPLERWQPLTVAWNRPRRDLVVDMKHLVVDSLFGNALWSALSAPLLRDATGAAALWPVSWPLTLQLGLGLLVFELVQYVLHLAMHRVPSLWRFHAVHHSSEKLDLASTFRNHPVDVALTVILPLVPIAALGGGDQVIVLTAVTVGVHSMVQHANIDFGASPFDGIVSTARLHRVHHRRDASGGAANYGGTLLVWDLLLGTRSIPANDAVEEVGVNRDAMFPETYLAQLCFPFRAASGRQRPPEA